MCDIDNQKQMCDRCGKNFAVGSRLYRHLRMVHDVQPETGRSPSSRSYDCCICYKSFALKRSVTKHLQNVHNIEVREKLHKQFQCEYCPRSYFLKKDLRKHQRHKHAEILEEINNVKEKVLSPAYLKICNGEIRLDLDLHKEHSYVTSEYVTKEPPGICPLCDTRVHHGDHVISHLREAHEVNIEKEELHFNSIDAFNIWKEQMCNETLTSYIKARGIQYREDGQRMYLNCHRSGKYRCHGKNLRFRDPEKTIKIGKVCPARIVVTSNSEGVSVIHYKTHIGHDNSLAYLRLRKSERGELAAPTILVDDMIAMTEDAPSIEVGEYKTHIGHDSSLTYLRLSKSEREELAAPTTLVNEIMVTTEDAPSIEVGDQRQKLANLMSITNGIIQELEEPDLPLAIKLAEKYLEKFKAIQREHNTQRNET